MNIIRFRQNNGTYYTADQAGDQSGAYVPLETVRAITGENAQSFCAWCMKPCGKGISNVEDFREHVKTCPYHPIALALAALHNIADFQPRPDQGMEPYSQIAAYAKQAARQAIEIIEGTDENEATAR